MVSLIKSIIICYLPAFSGVFFKPGQWYLSLNKPPLNPPGWIFGPVWTLLYFLMGVALWQIEKEADSTEKASAKRAFFVQLGLNALWTPVFFGSHRMGLAAMVLLALVLAIIKCLLAFYRIRKVSAFLLLPYLFWCLFAMYLNLAYFYLNQRDF